MNQQDRIEGLTKILAHYFSDVPGENIGDEIEHKIDDYYSQLFTQPKLYEPPALGKQVFRQSQPLDDKELREPISKFAKGLGEATARAINSANEMRDKRIIEEARKAGFDDGVKKTTVAMDSTIDAQIEEAKQRVIRQALDAMEIYDTEIKPNPYTNLERVLRGGGNDRAE